MSWLIETYLDEEYNILDELEESSTLHKAALGIKINRNSSRKKIFKEDHGNYKLLDYIEKCKNIQDLEYIRKDTYNGLKDMEKTYNNLKKIENGETPKKGSIRKDTYDFYIKEFVRKNITSKDAKLTYEFTKNKILPAIAKRIKELKN